MLQTRNDKIYLPSSSIYIMKYDLTARPFSQKYVSNFSSTPTLQTLLEFRYIDIGIRLESVKKVF